MPDFPVSKRMSELRETRALKARSSNVRCLRIRSSRTLAATRTTMALTLTTTFNTRGSNTSRLRRR